MADGTKQNSRQSFPIATFQFRANFSYLEEVSCCPEKHKLLRAEKLPQIIFFSATHVSIALSICQSILDQPVRRVLHSATWCLLSYKLCLSNPTNSLSGLEIAGSFVAKPGKMEATFMPEKQQASSLGVLQKILIFLVVFATCVGFFVGLLLVTTRLNSLEEAVNGLSEVSKSSWGTSQADILLSLA